MIYANQITLFYILSMYSAECQLYLNKAERKEKCEPVPGPQHGPLEA